MVIHEILINLMDLTFLLNNYILFLVKILHIKNLCLLHHYNQNNLNYVLFIIQLDNDYYLNNYIMIIIIIYIITIFLLNMVYNLFHFYLFLKKINLTYY